MKVLSKNGIWYNSAPAEQQKANHDRWYENHKESIVRRKILTYSLQVLGRIPTLSSIQKYDISPGELIQHFGKFKEKCQDTELLEKSQDKLMKRIQKSWA